MTIAHSKLIALNFETTTNFLQLMHRASIAAQLIVHILDLLLNDLLLASQRVGLHTNGEQ